MPANIRDNFAELQRFGLGNQSRTGPPRQFGSSLYPNVQVIDPNLDSEWARGYRDGGLYNTYFDYFFSGQDIKVFIDGTEEDPDFHYLPLIQMGFDVRQQKQPVFGFWSYTYDAVMRGTRMVSGTFTMATRTTNYMKQLLSKAAQSRQDRLGSAHYQYHRGLTEDDRNIADYWGKNRFDAAVAQGGNNIFSAHPPFSFVIVYGIQNVSLNDNMSAAGRYGDTPMMVDTNERLVEFDSQTQSGRIILDACELISMSTNFGPEGEVVAETYQFFGRDIVVP